MIIESPSPEQQRQIDSCRNMGINLQLAIISLLGPYATVETRQSNLRKAIDIAETAFHQKSGGIAIPPAYPEMRYNDQFYPLVPNPSNPILVVAPGREAPGHTGGYSYSEGRIPEEQNATAVQMNAFIYSQANLDFSDNDPNETITNNNLATRDQAHIQIGILLKAIELVLTDPKIIGQPFNMIDPTTHDRSNLGALRYRTSQVSLKTDFGIEAISVNSIETASFRQQLEFQLPFSSFGLLDFELLTR